MAVRLLTSSVRPSDLDDRRGMADDPEVTVHKDLDQVGKLLDRMTASGRSSTIPAGEERDALCGWCAKNCHGRSESTCLAGGSSVSPERP